MYLFTNMCQVYRVFVTWNSHKIATKVAILICSTAKGFNLYYQNFTINSVNKCKYLFS